MGLWLLGLTLPSYPFMVVLREQGRRGTHTLLNRHSEAETEIQVSFLLFTLSFIDLRLDGDNGALCREDQWAV